MFIIAIKQYHIIIIPEDCVTRSCWLAGSVHSFCREKMAHPRWAVNWILQQCTSPTDRSYDLPVLLQEYDMMYFSKRILHQRGFALHTQLLNEAQQTRDRAWVIYFPEGYCAKPRPQYFPAPRGNMMLNHKLTRNCNCALRFIEAGYSVRYGCAYCILVTIVHAVNRYHQWSSETLHL